MTAKQYATRITKKVKSIGVYKTEYDDVIKTLASILAKRDSIEKQYEEEGSEPVIYHTNSHGSTNASKNPLLMLIYDLNAQALNYWRDLGLTPAGLKKLGEGIKEEKKSELASALESLEN